MIMTITDMPRRARAAVRLSSDGTGTRFFEPWFIGPRKFSGRTQFSPAGLGPRSKAASAVVPGVTSLNAPGVNAPLVSLAGGSLASRFHAWFGASGQRYICSIFAADATKPDCGLPDFAEAIVLAVAREPEGERRLLALFCLESMSDDAARRQFVEDAWAAGATEWHIHLLSVDDDERHAVAEDIEARATSASAR